MRALSIERVLAAYCRQKKSRFLVSGRPEPGIRVFAPEAFLPVVALHAELAAKDLFGSQATLGSEFRPDDRALFDVFVRVPPARSDEAGVLRTLLYLHAAHKVFGLREGSIECAPVFKRYKTGLSERLSEEIPSWPLAQISPL